MKTSPSHNGHRNGHNGERKIRYAVVGLGHIAQIAVLPAFAQARNSELAALVSDDAVKLRALSRQYGVKNCYTYDDYEACLSAAGIDAVYVALPNNLHEEYCVRAARHGVHVLCEKPLASREQECRRIIQACAEAGVKLMTAYRLHFERANLEAVEIVRSGKIGEARVFNSTFTQQVRPGNIRVQPGHHGGPLYDLGVYCINAARYLFGEEPTQAVCFSATGSDPRFRKVEEMAAAILRFPGERLASFTASFGAADTADFEIIGTKGKVRAAHGYEYAVPVTLEITRGDRTEKKTFPRRDQFAPELLYFSDCILRNRDPEPSGYEGMRDVRIIEALHKSAQKGAAVRLKAFRRDRQPTLRQEIYRPKVRKPRLVKVQAPTV